MSVPDQMPVTTHTGNGTTTVFAYQYLLTSAADISVAVNGAVLDLGVDYSVSGLRNQSGGTVTFVVPPPIGSDIVLERFIALKRETDYQYSGDFQSPTVNDDFDRLWMAMQDSLLRIFRSVHFPLGERTDGQLPSIAQRAGMLLTFDTLGRPKVVAAAAQSATALQMDLASSHGPALVGWDESEIYPDATIGYAVKDLYDNGAGILTFQQPETGSVIRPMLAKMREHKSVLDFDVIGDGIVNDTAAFQKALDSGRDLFIPSGITVTGTAVTMRTRGQQILGPGTLNIRTVVRMPNTGDPYVSIIADISFVGVKFIYSSIPVMLRRGRGIDITKCTFRNSGTASILAQPEMVDYDAANHAVEDVHISNNTFSFVDRCLMIDVSALYAAMGALWWLGCGDVTFHGNTARVAKITHIEADRADGLVITSNTLLHYGSDPAVTGKKRCVEVNGRCAQVVIVGNQMFEAGLEAIYLRECNSGVITGNNIVQPGQVNLASGIRLDYIGAGYTYPLSVDANVVISGNTIYQPSKHGIELSNQSFVMATGNHVVADNANLAYYGDQIGNPPMSSITKRYAVFQNNSVGAAPREVYSEHNYSKQANAAKNPDGGLFTIFQKTRVDFNVTSTQLPGEYDQVNLNQAAASLVTTFSVTGDGREVTLIGFNSNTTLVHGATIKTKTGANFNILVGTAVKMYCYGSVWYQT